MAKRNYHEPFEKTLGEYRRSFNPTRVVWPGIQTPPRQLAWKDRLKRMLSAPLRITLRVDCSVLLRQVIRQSGMEGYWQFHREHPGRRLKRAINGKRRSARAPRPLYLLRPLVSILRTQLL